DGDGDGEPTTCGNDIEEPGDELCFELISLPLPAPGVALDVKIDPIGDENSYQSIIALTTSPDAPIVIWPYHSEFVGRFEEQPVIIEGPLPTIPGIEIGDYDPLAMEFADLVYATEAGVVIGWDHPGGFDDFMLALPCPNPTSFTT